MDFSQAEAKFRELQVARKRGEPFSQEEFEEESRQLTLRDGDGVWWTIHPETGVWFSYDGTEWAERVPPGHLSSSVSSAPAQETFPAATLATESTQSSGEPKYARAIRKQQLRQAVTFGPAKEIRRIPWFVLAIGGFGLLICLFLAWAGSGAAWQALSQRPVLTPAPLAGVQTSIPTIVQLPTPPAPAATPTGVLARIAESRVNVRAEPNLQAQIITTVVQDQTIKVIAKSRDGQWYQVIYQQDVQPAWIFGEMIRVVAGSLQGVPVVEQ